jgi:mannose-6-phosphate isomerase
MENRPLWLKNEIQEYAWGSYTFIQNLLGEAHTDTPWAELWMGAHPKAPSKVWVRNEWQRLDRAIAAHPEAFLGHETARRFDNSLPYLFKVLAARQPLSIQAHPDTEQARNGFERENHEGIPLTDPRRNYKDARHKPECLCALTPFWAMKGFRPISEMVSLFSIACPESLSGATEFLKQSPHANGVQRFFEALMTLPEKKIQQVIDEAAANAMANQEKDDAFRWIKTLYEIYPEDIGILSPILLNLVCLQPGEALFLRPGEMHAYLDGCGIEIMANSDNVLRGGLTAKHVDVEDLMRALDFAPRPLEVLEPQAAAACESVYPAPAEEFRLSVVEVSEDCSYHASSPAGPEVLLVIEGEARLSWAGAQEEMHLSRGGSVLIPASVGSYGIAGEARIYKAAVDGTSAAGSG